MRSQAEFDAITRALQQLPRSKRVIWRHPQYVMQQRCAPSLQHPEGWQDELFFPDMDAVVDYIKHGRHKAPAEEGIVVPPMPAKRNMPCQRCREWIQAGELVGKIYLEGMVVGPRARQGPGQWWCVTCLNAWSAEHAG